jgi:hypothetical protein
MQEQYRGRSRGREIQREVHFREDSRGRFREESKGRYREESRGREDWSQRKEQTEGYRGNSEMMRLTEAVNMATRRNEETVNAMMRQNKILMDRLQTRDINENLTEMNYQQGPIIQQEVEYQQVRRVMLLRWMKQKVK